MVTGVVFIEGAKEIFWSRIQMVLAPEFPFWAYKAKYRSADPVQASGLPSQAITYFTPNRADYVYPAKSTPEDS